MRAPGSFIKDKNKKPVVGPDVAARPKTEPEDVAAKRKAQEVNHAAPEK